MIPVPSVQTVAGTTLFHLAAAAYGDASRWDLIAAASGMVDPWVAGVTEVTVPRGDGKQPTGGVLGG